LRIAPYARLATTARIRPWTHSFAPLGIIARSGYNSRYLAPSARSEQVRVSERSRNALSALPEGTALRRDCMSLTVYATLASTVLRVPSLHPPSMVRLGRSALRGTTVRWAQSTPRTALQGDSTHRPKRASQKIVSIAQLGIIVREALTSRLQALLDHAKMGTIAQEPPKFPTNLQLTQGTLPKQDFQINKNALLALITHLLRKKSAKGAQLVTNVRLKGCQLWRIAQPVPSAL
jgi:hypothetical protein